MFKKWGIISILGLFLVACSNEKEVVEEVKPVEDIVEDIVEEVIEEPVCSTIMLHLLLALVQKKNKHKDQL